MKITMYELLGMVKDGKTMPRHIIFEEEDYYWVSSANDYICNDHDATQLFDNQYNMSNLPLFLGKKVEILEEEKKIPEKLEEPRFNKGRYYIKDINGNDSEISGIERTFRLKINEIIDYLKSKGDE